MQKKSKGAKEKEGRWKPGESWCVCVLIFSFPDGILQPKGENCAPRIVLQNFREKNDTEKINVFNKPRKSKTTLQFAKGNVKAQKAISKTAE